MTGPKFWFLPFWLWERLNIFDTFHKFGEIWRNEEKPSIIIDIAKAMLRSKATWVVLVVLLILYLVGIVAIFGEIFHFSPTPYDYEEIDYNQVRVGPSWVHPFGTDLIGRDILTRVIFSLGTCVSLSLLVVVFSVITGVSLGLIAGYYGGWKDWLIMRVGEVLSAVPPFFMFVYVTISLRSRYDEWFYSLGGFGEFLINSGFVDFSLIMFVMSCFYWVMTARVVRSETMKLRELPYVDAARALGAPSIRIKFWQHNIIVYHILPNIAGLIILWIFSALGSIVLMEVAISWLGLGIRPPHPSFGVIFSEIRDIRLISTLPHMLIFPGIVVTLWISCFFFLEWKLNQLIQSLYSK